MNKTVGRPVLDGPARRAFMMRVPVAMLLAVAFIAALIGVGGVLADPARAWPWVTVVVAGLLVAVLPVPVVWYRSVSSALIVGWDGVRLDGTLFPFSSVSRLLLVAGPDDQVIVAVDLRAGAALSFLPNR